MSWLTLAFLAMLVKSAQNFAEKSGQQRLGTWLVTFLIVAISTLIIAPYVLLTEPVPQFSPIFFIAVAMATLLYLVAKPLRLFALGTGDISEVVPLISFGSVFSLILGWIVLNEVPSRLGTLGVALIALGAYLINFERQQEESFLKKLIGPIKKLLGHKTQSLLMVSLGIASIISIFDKMAINNTYPVSPHYVLLMENVLIIPPLLVILRIKKVNFFVLNSVGAWRLPLIMGVLYSLRNLLLFSSLSRGYVGYVLAISQLSVVVAILGGAFFLKETRIKKKLISAMVMVSGAFLIGYFG